MKKKNSYIIIIIVTVLIILTLPLLFFIFEFARTMLYWSGYAPQITEHCGTEYYSSESYREFKGGEKASDYLPKFLIRQLGQMMPIARVFYQTQENEVPFH